MPEQASAIQLDRGRWVHIPDRDGWIWIANGGRNHDHTHGYIFGRVAVENHAPTGSHQPTIDLTRDSGPTAYDRLSGRCYGCQDCISSDPDRADLELDELPLRSEPNFIQEWMDRFEALVYDPDIAFNRAMLYTNGTGESGSMMMVCIDPECNAAHFMPMEKLRNHAAPVVKCCACNKYSAVPSTSMIRADGMSHYAAAGLLVKPLYRRAEATKRWRFMIDMRQYNPLVIDFWDRGSVFGFNGEFFDKTKAHFIRARANFETLSDIYTLREWSNPHADQVIVGWETSRLTEVVSEAQWSELAELIERIADNPTQVLDPAKADSVREQVTREAWNEDEQRRFLRLLKESGIARTEAPLERLGIEFWNGLYSTTIRGLDVRPVIKRTGVVQFPTESVVAAVRAESIEKTWRDFGPTGIGTIEEFFDLPSPGS